MRVLGLGTEGDSGAAIVEDGRFVAAVNEERLSRLKLVVGFPRAAIRTVLQMAGTSMDGLDAVLVASTRDLFVNDLRPFDGWFQDSPNGVGGRLKKLAGSFARYRDRLPFLEAGYYRALRRVSGIAARPSAACSSTSSASSAPFDSWTTTSPT